MALDEFQLPFCTDPRRALRLLAPAGSGKTHSLLWRCLHQWEQPAKTKPRFLLFTFTKAARDELRDRLRSDPSLRPISGVVEVSTLNAWGFRRLKSKSHNLRLLTSSQDMFFAVNNILQPVWSKHKRIEKLLKETKARNRAAKVIMDVMDGLKSLGFRHDQHHKVNEFVQHLAWLKQAGLGSYYNGLIQKLADIEIIDPKSPNITLDLEKHFLKFWHEASKLMRQMAVITLEDQKYWTWLELEESLAEGKFTTGMHRFDHVLVDEFQDVNCLDLRLLQSIAAVNKAELTVVGDDDQAIYEWRGASPEFILKPDDYVGSGFATHILSRNYRSPRNIVLLSQQLIRHNKRRVDKEIIPHSKVDAKVEVIGMSSLSETIDFVVAEVRAMLANPEIKKVAIIGRKRGQIIPYQIVFASHNIPFYAAEDLQVFLSTAFGEMKDILGIKARAGAGPIPGFDPIQDLVRLCDNVKRFPLSKTDRAALLRHLQSERPRTLPAAVTCLRAYTGTLKGTNQDGRMSQAYADAVQALLEAATVAGSIRALSDHFDGLQKDYGKSTEDIFYTDPPFLHLSEFAERYGSDYGAFYEDIEKAISTLARIPDDDDTEQQQATPDWKLPLHLMTALRAKGKEFDVVILLDVNQEIWPSKLAETPDQLEQERRVFYVAMTRARKRLMMLVNDHLLGRPVLPSPYLAEMGLVPDSDEKVTP